MGEERARPGVVVVVVVCVPAVVSFFSSVAMAGLGVSWFRDMRCFPPSCSQAEDERREREREQQPGSEADSKGRVSCTCGRSLVYREGEFVVAVDVFLLVKKRRRRRKSEKKRRKGES